MLPFIIFLQVDSVPRSFIDRCSELCMSKVATKVQRSESGIKLFQMVYLLHQLGLHADRGSGRAGASRPAPVQTR